MKYRLVIDGVDKTGKDLLLKYVVNMSNHKYVIQSRGILTQIAYSKIYNRPYTYDLNTYKNDIIIYLTGELEDLKIRHKITNEPKIDLERDIKVFDEVVNDLRKNGIKVITLNTSLFTPYANAKAIIDYVEELECLTSKTKELN